MFAVNRCARVLACLAAFGMLASPVLGAKPISGGQQVKQHVFDVKLADGHLLGQVVNANGKPAAGSRVALLSQSSAIAATQADSHGRFSLPVPKPGAYRVLVADRAVTVRTWRA